MKKLATCLLALSATWLAALPAQAAFLIQVDLDGSNTGAFPANLTLNPRVTFGGDTTAPGGSSVHSTAVGLALGNSIFAGNGVALPDTYVFSYDMTADGDNLALAPGTLLNNDGPAFRDTASGAAAGGAGLYNVWTTWPATNNVSGGPTQYQLLNPANVPLFTFVLDQNNIQGQLNTATPPVFTAGGEWIYLGTAPLDGASTYRVVQSVTLANSFVSMRAEGVLFEPAVPEPASCALAGLGALGLLVSRRRG